MCTLCCLLAVGSVACDDEATTADATPLDSESLAETGPLIDAAKPRPDVVRPDAGQRDAALDGAPADARPVADAIRPDAIHNPGPTLGFSGVANLARREPDRVEAYLASMGYADDEAYFDDAIQHMVALSAGFARAELFYVGDGRFAGEDRLWRRMIDAGFEVVMNVNPIPPTEDPDDGFEPAIRELVRSWPEIQVWQIGNEPDLLWADHSRYADFFLRAQPVIREACPTCRIMLAGISNQYDSDDASHGRYDAYLQAIAAGETQGVPFDIFDFHYYKGAPDRSEIRQAAETYRALLTTHGLNEGVALWCTETGVYTGDPPPPQFTPHTEEDQARGIVQTAVWMTEAGVRRVLFWTVVESWGVTGMEGFFDQMGLIYNGLGSEEARGLAGGTRKKAYATFGVLASAMMNLSQTTRLQAGVYRLDGPDHGPDSPVYIVWDEGGTGSVTVDGIEADALDVIDLVPDDDGALTQTRLEISDGSLTLAVDANPRLVRKTAGQAPPAPTRVYASFVSHNEEAPHAVCTPVLTDPATYLDNRRLSLAFAEMVIAHQAAWDLQSDWQYLEAVRQWDTPEVTADTEGKNLIRYLAEVAPDRIVIEAHAHETQYNYADVVHLIEGLGVARNGVVGGFLYFPYEREAWTRLREPLSGQMFPDTTWTAEILWGAGTAQHVGPDSRISGVWRPRDAAHFHEDDPTQRLINIGGYMTNAPGLTDLLEQAARGELAPNEMYTAAIFVPQCGLNDEMVRGYADTVDGLAAHVEAGRLIWTTLPEMARIWAQEYDQRPLLHPAPGFEPDNLTPEDCLEGAPCGEGLVCCPAEMPCAGQCVDDCRVGGAERCPAQAPRCNQQTGLCER